MKVIYEADDGKQFDNEEACFYYDWNLNHPNIKDVKFLDSNGVDVPYTWEECDYYKTETVVVPTESALKDLHDFADLLGFCDYKAITAPGIWKHHPKDPEFIPFLIEDINKTEISEKDFLSNSLYSYNGITKEKYEEQRALEKEEDYDKD